MATATKKKPKRKRTPQKMERTVPKEKILDHENSGRRRFKIGKQTGLGLCEYLFNIFERNEKISPKDKLTDAGILAAVSKEFRANSEIAEAIENGTYPIAYYRSIFNRDMLLRGKYSDIVSFRYNHLGQRVDGRNLERLLNPEECKGFEAKYKSMRAKVRKKFAAKNGK